MDDHRPWARGKTYEEALGITSVAMDYLDKFNLSGKALSNSATPPAYPSQAAQPAAYGQPQQGFQPQQPQPDPNDYMTYGQLQAFLQQQAQQQIAPQINNLYESQAATNLQWIRARPEYRTTFEKYGPEVNALIAQVPPAARTLDNLQLLVDTVRGRHVDEIARERAAELAATTPPTMRPNGFAGSPGAPPLDNGQSLSSDKIPQAWKDRAIAQGLTDESIREFCRANNQTPEQFYAMLNKSKVVTDTSVLAEKRDTEGKLIGREITLG